MPVVLVTGASRGIGLGLVQSFARDGWHVHACCRRPEKARTLHDIDGEIRVHRLDVTDGLAVAGIGRKLADEAIDVLINNAGVYGPRTGFGETDYDDWRDVLEVNTLAPLRLVERLIEPLARSGRGLVVNVSSVMGSIGENTSGGSYIYRSSKAALNMVTKGLAVDLASRGITVVSVHPGWVRTDMGGAQAAVSVEASVDGLRKVIDGLAPGDSGGFFGYDGRPIAW